MFSRSLIFFIVLFTIFQISNASTVTLTGSCSQNIINQTSNSLIFNLTNSGDGAATNLLFIPTLDGASTYNKTVSLSLIAPGNTSTIRFQLYNFSLPGTYSTYIVTKYSQDASTFITIFPCLINLQKSTRSVIGILNLTQSRNKVSVYLINLATRPIATTVVAEAPPTFTINNSVRNITIGPYEKAGLIFNISKPQYANARFPIAFSASYSDGTYHYSTLAVNTISFSTASSNTSFDIGILIILIIAVLLVLILISIIRKRKRKQKTEQ